MSVTLRNRPAADRVVLNDVSWGFYRQFIEDIGDQNIRVTYNNGAMEIMSPLPIHEKSKKSIARMIELLTLERLIRMASWGSTTYADDTLEKGLEPDECYYFANEPAVRGKERIDLSVDPPPDLAIEVDISYRQMKRESIYAAMKVPEIWRWDGERLDCLVLDADGVYQPSEFSKSLPMVRVRDLEQFIHRLGKDDETTIMRSFLEWVRALPA